MWLKFVRTDALPRYGEVPALRQGHHDADARAAAIS
jgi:hypothetical protein